jgi:hypothetical protein
MKTTFFFLLILALPSSVVTQTRPLDFFPHHLGDMWEYFVLDGVGNDTIQDRIIFDSTDTEGTVHLRVERLSLNPTGPAVNTPWFDEYRIDTTGQVFASGGGWFNRLQYKLNATVGTVWISDPAENELAEVLSVYQDTLFGQPTTAKFIRYGIGDSIVRLVHYEEVIAEGLGVIFRGGGDLGYNLYLRGAFIDGRLYGDTTIVSVHEHHTPEFSTSITLYPNFPNPFNSSTIFTFSIPIGVKITLKVFDVLGREIAMLADEKINPGTYSIGWTPKELPSGVYFYRLQAGKFTDMKMMLLIR